MYTLWNFLTFRLLLTVRVQKNRILRDLFGHAAVEV
jgi:hypothetical protein